MKRFSENAANYLGSLQGWLLPSNQSTDQPKEKLKPISIFTYFQNIQEVSFIMQDITDWEGLFNLLAWSKKGMPVKCPTSSKSVKIYNMNLLVNGESAVEIKRFNITLLPQCIKVREECELELHCSYNNGSVLATILPDSSVFIKYNNGDLIGMSLPNTIKFFGQLNTPIFTVCNGKICILPFDNNEYHRLSSIIHRNCGSIEIRNLEEYKLEYLGNIDELNARVIAE